MEDVVIGGLGRNDPCYCGSGKKYKRCCLPRKEKRLVNPVADDDWGYELFSARFPEIAENETRSVIIMEGKGIDLPLGTYVFNEMFCRERGCDCRRVFFCVTSAPVHNAEAVVCYGWESSAFYKKWYKDADPEAIAGLQGPALNSGSPQSKYAPIILELVKNILIKDRNYVDRLKRHYHMFKAEIDKK